MLLPSYNSMLKISVLSPLRSRFLPCSCWSSWIFHTLDGDDSLKCSIIYIKIIIINQMMEYKIYIDVPFSWASSFCKSRTRSYFAFLTSFEYPPVFLRSSIKFPGSTSFLQYQLCWLRVLCLVKCLRHLVQKCFFTAWL